MKSCPECTATYPNDYAICPKDGAPLQESTLWQIGTVVRGKYRIKARLGEGGMAYVYKAHHELLDEYRALKVIKPELARDTEFMSRFRNEAIMARKLNHPNAVRVDDMDYGEDGLPFIAMELVVGDTLHTLVQKGGPLPVSLVLAIAANVCEALGAAHKLGLIHRDIKPENIVLIPQGEGPPIAKILDFGISRLREQTQGLTQTGIVIGTPEYMSPEQARGKGASEIDGRSDLYSLGVVMYRMLTGELPFQAETQVEMMLAHIQTPAKAPHRFKPELAIPEAVSLIVMKAMEKDPEKRFATGAEMAAAIKKARGSTTLATRKIDWESLSNAAASFGSEKSTPPSNAVRSSPRPAALAAVAPNTPISDKSFYRSPRIAPPRREFPTFLALMLVALAALLGGAYAAWKYLAPLSAAKQVQGGTIPIPAKTPELSPAGEQKVADPATTVPTSPTPSGERPAARQDLSDAEKKKINDLNAEGARYKREGGCEKALHDYQEVLVIDPGNPIAYAAVQKCETEARRGGNPIPVLPAMPAPAPAPTTNNTEPSPNR